MRHVTFAQAILPYNAGDKRIVPDEMAANLEAGGYLSANEPFGPKAAQDPKKPHRPMLKIGRPSGIPDTRVAR
jgi:hypothetical protein